MRHPIYENCNLTAEESRTILLAQALRYGFSDSALASNLDVIDCHLPHDVHSSKYQFLKNFPNPRTVKYYFCLKCCLLLYFEGTNTVICQTCSQEFSKQSLDKIGHYFLYLPIKEQLMDFCNSKYYKELRKIDEDISDVINGKYYQQLKKNNIIGENDISIQWNTDGIKTFNSSRPSIWAILIQINELPYRLRKNHIICCSIWFVSKKPPMNIFLRPFVEELIELHQVGMETTTYLHQNPIRIKVHTLLAPVDSSARPSIQNIHQYNGEFGCSYCLIPGESVPYGRGHTWVYSGDKHEGRSIAQHSRDCDKVVKNPTLENVNGVMGPSVVQLLPIFHIIWSVPPEYLHSVCEGVIQLITSQSFNSRNHQKPWYLGLVKKEFDEILLKIKPPSEITRCPKSIEERALWKGSEWKNFLLYYSLICFKPFMTKEHYQHWFLFVYSMQIFLKEKITDAEHTSAAKALRLFVLGVETSYGKEFMKFNVHILLHIPQSVRNFGALWAWSTFPFENYNGVLKLLFKGSQYLPEQIAKFYSRLRYVKLSSEVFSKPNCSLKGKAIFQTLMKECKVKRCIEYGEGLRAFGASKDVSLTEFQLSLIQNVLQENVEINTEFFERFIYNHVLFHVSSCSQLKKRINCVIQTNDGNFVMIVKFLSVKTETQSKKQVIIGKELEVIEESLCEFENFSSSDFAYM